MAKIDRDSIKISRLDRGEEEAYFNFLLKAYQNEFNNFRYRSVDEIRRFWCWEYVENPYKLGGEPFVWICRIDDNIIGQLCLMPAPVKIGDKLYRGGWYQDFIVLPEFRGMGIGEQLICKARDSLKDIIDIGMAIPATERSKAIFRKEGFTEVAKLNKNISLRKVSSVLLHMKGMRKRYGVEVREIGVFNDQIDKIWEYLSGKPACMIKRDSAILSWRFTPQPYWRYLAFIANEGGSPKGCVIVKNVDDGVMRSRIKTGMISDLFFDPSEAHIGCALMAKAMDAMKGGLQIVRCDAMDPAVQRFLESCGFVTVKSDNMLMIWLSDRIEKERISLALDGSNWYITHGDSDLDFA